NRLSTGLQPSQDLLTSQGARLSVKRPLLGEIGDVRPGDKCLGAGAGDDRTRDVGAGGDFFPGAGQVFHDSVVQRVQLVRPVDGDEGNAVADVEEQLLVAHANQAKGCPGRWVARYFQRMTQVDVIGWTPAGALRLLDQTLLPGEIRHLELDTTEGIIEAIQALRVRGAPLIG